MSASFLSFAGVFGLLLFLCGVLADASPAAAQRQKVIVDCDLGGDVDDAYALALLLASPEFEILGVTVGHGRTADRARVALRMLYEAGLDDVPVYVGRETPLEVGRDTSRAPYARQFYWAKGFDSLQPQAEPAADFIIRTLHRYPGQVLLLTLGPLSNLADVLAREPGVLKQAKGVVAMLGSFYRGYDGSPEPSAEWNVYADVEAARMLLASGADLTLAGLEVTDHVTLDAEDRLHLLFRRSPLTDAVSALFALWWKEHGEETLIPKLFDAVAVGLALWPDLFTTRPLHVRVDEEGYTRVDDDRPPNARVALAIDREAFLERFMERLLTQNLGRP